MRNVHLRVFLIGGVLCAILSATTTPGSKKGIRLEGHSPPRRLDARSRDQGQTRGAITHIAHVGFPECVPPWHASSPADTEMAKAQQRRLERATRARDSCSSCRPGVARTRRRHLSLEARTKQGLSSSDAVSTTNPPNYPPVNVMRPRTSPAKTKPVMKAHFSGPAAITVTTMPCRRPPASATAPDACKKEIWL
ncbi:hypothetical protein MRX96_014347 [Rhipicephalus microplus]